MLVILACLSLILTAGGGAMALYGADLIRSESGLALTQSGITMLSAGLVLAGLTTVVAELRRMRRLMELDDVPVPPASLAPVAPPLAVPERNTPVHVPADPIVALKQEAPAVSERPSTPPLPPVPEPKRPGGSGIPAEAKASLAGIAAARAPKPVAGTSGATASSDPAGTGEGDRGLHAGSTALSASPDAAGPDARTTRSASDAAKLDLASGEAALDEAARKEAAHEATHGAIRGAIPGEGAEVDGAAAAHQAGVLAPGASIADVVVPPATTGARRMLATYNSGGITYFMFSDGSIEADMTGGRFRFTSMDELRGYIETGKGGVLVESPAG
jgi:hypothetical protein